MDELVKGRPALLSRQRHTPKMSSRTSGSHVCTCRPPMSAFRRPGHLTKKARKHHVLWDLRAFVVHRAERIRTSDLLTPSHRNGSRNLMPDGCLRLIEPLGATPAPHSESLQHPNVLPKTKAASVAMSNIAHRRWSGRSICFAQSSSTSRSLSVILGSLQKAVDDLGAERLQHPAECPRAVKFATCLVLLF